MICCGTECNTKFCPNCGKQLAEDDSLVSLAVHCEKQAKLCRLRAQTHRKTAETRGDKLMSNHLQREGDYLLHLAVKNEESEKKWLAWASAVRKAAEVANA